MHIPYGIGCGLGGGDWEEMKSLFDFYFGESPVKLYIHFDEKDAASSEWRMNRQKQAVLK